MKAIINGIVVEGTPEEIMEYQALQEEKAKRELMSKLSNVTQPQLSLVNNGNSYLMRTGTR